MLAPQFEQLGAEIRADLGARLKYLREWRELRVHDVAASTGITTVYIYSLERGDANPTVQVLAALATVYRVDVADMFVFPTHTSLRQRARDLVRLVANEALPALVANMEHLLNAAKATSSRRKPPLQPQRKRDSQKVSG